MASIGDQIFTDVLGANLFGITSIFVEPISKEDTPIILKILVYFLWIIRQSAWE